ncbi:MAG: phospholipase D-like domain-containing protein [Candidatus Gracilibacteria bacterium]|nr:phospholipase D-like domain-containing protein [Candidatus Gracilibacteria bacterium]
MLKKLFTFLFVITFFGVFSYFYGEDFFKNIEKQENLVNQKKIISGKLSDFSIEKIRELENTEFYYTPSQEVLGKIVHLINKSEKSVYIEVYMLTEKKIKIALFNAKNRGVDIKIILEHSPYLAKSLNRKYFEEYKDAGLNITWSNPQNYTLNHSKIILIDNNKLILSTGNFTASNFKKNRDLFIFTEDKYIINAFNNIFNSDFIGEKITFYEDNLVISPDYSRIKIEKLISSAKNNIKIYIPYLSDNNLLKLIEEKINSGVKIEMIMSDYGYEKFKLNKKENFFIEKLKKNKNFIFNEINKNGSSLNQLGRT